MLIIIDVIGLLEFLLCFDTVVWETAGHPACKNPTPAILKRFLFGRLFGEPA